MLGVFCLPPPIALEPAPHSRPPELAPRRVRARWLDLVREGDAHFVERAFVRAARRIAATLTRPPSPLRATADDPPHKGEGEAFKSYAAFTREMRASCLPMARSAVSMS